MSSDRQLTKVVIFGALLAVAGVFCAGEAQAVGVFYADPGWHHAFDGNSAYYHDPDGPHPDYVNGGDTNEPGGRGGEPALIDVGTACEPNCEEIAIWQNRGSEWEGSAPGAPLGGTPIYGQQVPPLKPPAPGGVGTFTDESTTFLRIQDPGLPNPYGWADKNAQMSATSARQEGNNRRIEFMHEMSRDAGFSDRLDILDFGVTVAFRARISTAATGPIDDIFNEDGPAPEPWPTNGVGYTVANNARGMIMISQNGAAGAGRIAFSLMDTNAINQSGIVTSNTGLVMNNKAIGAGNPGNPDTNEITAQTLDRLNLVAIDNAALTEWHEFWITIKAMPAPSNGNTHEVNVYRDGSLTPETFPVILGNQNESGVGSFLGMGLSSGSRWGAFDLDYIAYKEGVIVPTLVPSGPAGDYNDNGVVDAADYAVWRNNVGTDNPLDNDLIGGTIGQAHYDQWKANFGKTMGSGASTTTATVPEPSTFALVALAAAGLSARRQRTANSIA